MASQNCSSDSRSVPPPLILSYPFDVSSSCMTHEHVGRWEEEDQGPNREEQMRNSPRLGEKITSCITCYLYVSSFCKYWQTSHLHSRRFYDKTSSIEQKMFMSWLRVGLQERVSVVFLFVRNVLDITHSSMPYLNLNLKWKSYQPTCPHNCGIYNICGPRYVI